jgi:hypothetical protein
MKIFFDNGTPLLTRKEQADCRSDFTYGALLKGQEKKAKASHNHFGLMTKKQGGNFLQLDETYESGVKPQANFSY